MVCLCFAVQCNVSICALFDHFGAPCFTDCWRFSFAVCVACLFARFAHPSNRFRWSTDTRQIIAWFYLCMRTKLAFVLGIHVFTVWGCWFPMARFLFVRVFSWDLERSVMRLSFFRFRVSSVIGMRWLYSSAHKLQEAVNDFFNNNWIMI